MDLKLTESEAASVMMALMEVVGSSAARRARNGPHFPSHVDVANLKRARALIAAKFGLQYGLSAKVCGVASLDVATVRDVAVSL